MGTSLQLASIGLPEDGLHVYMQRVNGIPLLTKEQEFKLATAYRENNDIQAAHELVVAHLRYVVKVAKGYMGYGLALGDLIQEGTVGLMKAVKRFEPEQGYRLVSFAVHWIKSEIHEFVLKNWRIVKVATTKAQRKLFFNLRSAKKRLGWFSKEEVESVARDLGVSPQQVLEMEGRLNAHDCVFDPIEVEDDKASFSPSQYLDAPKHTNPEQHLEQSNWAKAQQSALMEGLGSLDSRSQDILRQRWLNENDKATLKSLAEKYGISLERVRQVEALAMKKLKAHMLENQQLS